MPFGVMDIVYGVGAPAFFAAAMILLLGRFALTSRWRSVPAPVALTVGFLSGYWLLSLGPVTPAAHWHWLPFTVVMAAIAAPVSRSAAMPRFVRVLLVAVVAAIAMGLLVPTWDDLQPPRAVQIATWAVVVTGSALALDSVSERLPGPVLPAILALTLMCGSIVLALAGSLRFAQVAGCGVGSLIGIWAAGWLDHKSRPLAGIALPYAVLTGGAMLVGHVNSFSDVPLISYLLIPVATATLWLSVKGPLANAAGVRSWVVLSLPVLVSAAAVIIALLSETT